MDLCIHGDPPSTKRHASSLMCCAVSSKSSITLQITVDHLWTTCVHRSPTFFNLNLMNSSFGLTQVI